MFSSATQPPRGPPPRHNFVVSSITFGGIKLRSSNLTQSCIIHPNISDEFDNWHCRPIQNGRRRLFCQKNSKNKKSCVSMWNGQKCDRKWFLHIQYGRRRPFCPNFKKSLRSVWIWNGQKCHRNWISDIQNGRSIRNGQKCNWKWFSN